ncbi:MAG: hypothetical protein KDK51_02665, partial [Deltaproteobacteria bacterium]|nr:hypothetical protein [Deltaproteobacteria bacterium]
MAEVQQSSWSSKVRSFFGAKPRQDPFAPEELEALLYQSDLSIALIQTLLKQTRPLLKKGQEAVLQSLFDQTKSLLEPLYQQPFTTQVPSAV